MGMLDDIVDSAENDVETTAKSKINSAISGGINKAGSKSTVSVCPKCKAQLPIPMPKFCPKCGAQLSLTCKKCGKDYPLGTKFCPDDGTKLT